MYSFFYEYKLHKLKHQFHKINNCYFIILISINLLFRTNSMLIKNSLYSFVSEIKIKILRQGNFLVIQNNFLAHIYAMNVNGKNVEKNCNLYMNKYRNIIKIEINPNINNCFGMFQDCKDIVEMDLSHFDASHVSNMGNMFSGCSSLTSINFTNFDTSSVTFSMHYMFFGCSKLYSLDLSGFKTETVKCIEHMFDNCYSLVSLDLSNFKTETINSNSMFSNCKKLEYINLYNAKVGGDHYNTNLFSGISKHAVFCINPSNSNYFQNLPSDKCLSINSNLNCESIWRESQIKLKALDGNCLNNFDGLPNYKCDSFNKCYDSCTIVAFLNGICKIEYEDKDSFIEAIINSLKEEKITELLYDKIVKGESVISNNDNEIIQISTLSSHNKTLDLRSIYFDEFKNTLYKYGYDEQDDFIILKIHNKLNNSNDFLTEYILFSPDGKDKLDLNLCKVPNLRQYKSKQNDTCLDYCSIERFMHNKCKVDHDNQDILTGDIIEFILNGSLLNITEDEVLIGENGTEIYQISTLSNQLKVRNITYIDFGDCESKLKSANNVNETEELILLKIEHKLAEIKIPIVEYVLFSPDGKRKLDLNECKNTRIHQFTEININKDEIFKYDTNGYYYNDKCSIDSENGIDKIIFDRKKEFNDNNMSLCEKNCDFNGYNSANKRVDCECYIKESLVPFYNVTINTDSLINKLKNIKDLINIEVIKCYKLIFSIKGLVKNIGNHIFLSLILVNTILIIIFYCRDFKIFKKKINKLLKKMFNQYRKDKNKLILKNKIKNQDNKSSHYKNRLNTIQLNNPVKKNQNKNAKFNKSSQIMVVRLKTKNEFTFGKINTKKEEFELNYLDYKNALKFDHRTYSQYYYSLLKEKQLFMFTFIRNNDYNSRIIKICLFINDFALSFTVNALFFNDSTMHKIYTDEGRYNLLYQIPQILYSSLISIAISNLLIFISLTEKNVLNIKNKHHYNSAVKEKNKLLKFVWIKFMIFHILNTLFMIFFWFYVSSFCAVYHNTQVHLITDTLISYGTSNLYPFIIGIFPGIFRTISLKSKGKRLLMFKFSLILASL